VFIAILQKAGEESNSFHPEDQRR